MGLAPARFESRLSTGAVDRTISGKLWYGAYRFAHTEVTRLDRILARQAGTNFGERLRKAARTCREVASLLAEKVAGNPSTRLATAGG